VSPPEALQRSDAILDRLLTLHPKLIDLSLDRMHRILAALGHPERALPPVIHIAGTNGKGSVAAMLRAGLEAAGEQVHVYTSPHLVRFHERIRLAGALIDEGALSALLEECEAANGGAPITYFEITTAAALLAFSRTPADYLILETGLGGRLDATNVVETPAMTVITTISLDHQQYLGETLGEIAGEKAGILKRGAPCLVGPQTDEAMDAIERRADALGAELITYGRDWQSWEEHGRLIFQDNGGLMDLGPPALAGRHQYLNAGVAIAALKRLGCDDEACAAGPALAQWPGRLQRLRGGMLADCAPEGADIILDGGHNEAAGKALADYLATATELSGHPVYLVCGMLKTKNAADFFAPFDGVARRVYTVPIPDAEASFSADELANLARSAGLYAEACQNVADAVYAIGASAEPGARIVICGSLYLVGATLREYGPTPG